MSSVSRTATDTPRADHFFLPAVRLGKSVPLTGGGRPGRAEEQPFAPEGERAKGRTVMVWGRGAKAGPGGAIGGVLRVGSQDGC